MYRTIAVFVAALLAAPPVSLTSAPTYGTVQGTLTVGGRPVSGVDVALVDINSGAIHRARSVKGGAFQLDVAPGEYVLSSGSSNGLGVSQAPARLSVAAGRVASTRLDLVALPLPRQEPPPETLPDTQPPAGINHQEIGCIIAGQYPLFDAVIEPMQSVVRARVYFKAARTEDYFYVEMTPDVGRFIGKLPRPRLEASPIIYYIQATTAELGDTQTPEIPVLVVEDESQCPKDKRVAAIGPPGPVQVFSAATGALTKPIGFAAGAAGLSALTLLLLAGGAAAIGITAVVVNNPPHPTPEPSHTPEPHPTETPHPTPTPTPTPEPTSTPPPPSSFSR